MALTPGTRLGVYEVTAAIGAGGMGEVYRARDTKLDRDVAVKVLPESFASDADRLARFEREAKTLASLNHPNIAAIYGIEGHALVMELVEGEDLSALIARGPVSLPDALPIARQIADALEAAHEQGIIHRDLKPANVKVRPDGTVKVLDFGLAKAIDQAGASSADVMNSPTLTAAAFAAGYGGPGTQMGMILGTAAYMAPEQARGRAVDRRADIWAFGVVLYEMLSGQRAFAGEDISITLASVLKEDVRWDALPSDLPAPLVRLLRRCLERDPKKRLQAIGEARIAIDEVLGGGGAATSSPAQLVATARPRGWIAAAAVLAALFLVSATLAVTHLRETRPTPATVAFEMAPPEAIGDMRSFDAPVVSPDGRHFAISGPRGLSVRGIDSTQASPLEGTGTATSPFWSPDSRFIAYFQNTQTGGTLKRVSIAGGAPDAGVNFPWPAYYGAWGPDGTIVVAGLDTLYRIPVGGGAPTPLTTLDTSRGETRHVLPSFLPDGRHLLYLSVAGDVNNVTVRIRSLDSSQTSDLMTGVRDARYAQTANGAGYLLFVRAGELWAQTLDGRSLELSGDPVRIAAGIENRLPLAGAAFSASTNGVLTYRIAAPPERSQLVWYDRSGKLLGTVGDPAIYSNPSLSLDERWLAISQMDDRVGTRDIWVIDLLRKASSRLTVGASDDLNPVWSPDGKEVAYSSADGAARHIFRKLASGVGEPRLVLKSTAQNSLEDWSRDGRDLLYNVNSAAIWRVPVSGDGTASALSKDKLAEDQAQLSPDGHWLAYRSREAANGGADEVYVQTFPPGDNRWQISNAGGQQPRWRGDGRELFYLAGDQLMAVSVTARGNVFEAGVPQPLFRVIVERTVRRNYFVVSADGQRFLVVQAVRSTAPPRMAVTINWAIPANK